MQWEAKKFVWLLYCNGLKLNHYISKVCLYRPFVFIYFEMAPFVLIVQAELFGHFLLHSYSDTGLYNQRSNGERQHENQYKGQGNDLCSFRLRMSGLNHSLQAFLLALSFSDRRIVLMHKCVHQPNGTLRENLAIDMRF